MNLTPFLLAPVFLFSSFRGLFGELAHTIRDPCARFVHHLTDRAPNPGASKGGVMAQYARGECQGCNKILTKDQMTQVRIAVVTGHSGSSFGFFGGTRSNARGRYSGAFRGARWSSGRSYTSNRNIWLCDDCLREWRRQRVMRVLGSIATIIFVIIALMVLLSDNSGSNGPQDTSTAVDTPTTSPAPAATMSLAQAPALDDSTDAVSTASNPAIPTSTLSPAVATQTMHQDLGTQFAAASVNDQSSSAPLDIAQVTNTPASVLSQAALQYPPDAMRENAQGEVIIDASITAGGAVESAKVEQSSGYRSLDAAALQSVRQWQFNPARRNGEPVSTMIRIPINFAPPRRE